MSTVQPTTVDDILSSARTLLVDGGYNGFSYADIAGTVGITKASIHYHFPTKADLVCAALQRYRTEFDDGIAQINRHHPNAPDRLKAYLAFWQDCIEDPTTAFCICALLANEIPILPTSVAEQVAGHFRALSGWLTAVLAHGAEQGSITLCASPHDEAETFMATVHGAMLSARAYAASEVFTTITNAALARLLA